MARAMMKTKAAALIHALGFTLAMVVHESAPAQEEVTIEHQGITLNARLARTESWPGGPVFLMAHGTFAHNQMEIMATVQELLAEAEFSSLAINLGLSIDDRHGNLACETPHAHRDSDALDEIGLWLEWLKARGAERVVLLGHSRSGNQIARFVLDRDTPQVEALVLIAPSTWDADRGAKNYQESFGVRLSMRLEEARELVAAGKPGAWMEQTGFIFCAGAKVTAATFLDYYEPEEYRDTPSVLPAITKPTLVFAGSEDKVNPPLEAKAAAVADGERVKLFVIDGADHFFRDLYADEIVEIIAEELAGS
jgi:pimeloyl-ACP methyl ester carboxylesterase